MPRDGRIRPGAEGTLRDQPPPRPDGTSKYRPLQSGRHRYRPKPDHGTRQDRSDSRVDFEPGRAVEKLLPAQRIRQASLLRIQLLKFALFGQQRVFSAVEFSKNRCVLRNRIPQCRTRLLQLGFRGPALAPGRPSLVKALDPFACSLGSEFEPAPFAIGGRKPGLQASGLTSRLIANGSLIAALRPEFFQIVFEPFTPRCSVRGQKILALFLERCDLAKQLRLLSLKVRRFGLLP